MLRVGFRVWGLCWGFRVLRGFGFRVELRLFEGLG